MQEIWSFGGVIALWLGISIGLWWLHRRSVHGRQRRELDQSERAAVFVADAPAVFDAIRTRPAAASRSADPQPRLTADTHALLKRIQDYGAFFDRVNALRVQMQASFGVDDYQPLSEILQVRRDLWASSEIVLVEDLSSFGSSFAEEGAYERFRNEAVELMFKVPAAAGDDVIDLRLSLAREDAERFIVELRDAIAAARERDRLPTPAEIIAYPVAAIRAMPEKLRVARNFASAFFAYSGDIARSIRDSETMERGRRHLQTAREELPQRLSTGFERASKTALEHAGNLKRHYDFLVAAHDFQAKYERVLSRAPELTERGRQFIARLDLAERSERLRLTSANVLIWLARRLIDVLAHFIAGLQILYGALSRTTLWAFAEAMVAPTPMRGRQTSAFPSFQMALAASGLSEEREPAVAPPVKAAVQAAKAKSKSPTKNAKAKTQPARAKAKSGETKKVAAAKEKSTKPAKIVAPPKANATPASPPPANAKPATETTPAPSPRKEPVVQQAASARGKAKAAAAKPVVEPPAPVPVAEPEKISTPEEKKPLKIIPKVAKPAVVDLPEPKPVPEKPPSPPADPISIPEPIPAPAAEMPQPAIAPIAAETEKRPSFFARLFGGGKPAVVERVEQPLPEPEPWPEPEFADTDETSAADVAETKPTLLARLSEIGGDAEDIAADDGDADEESLDGEPEDDADDATDEAGPLTLSLMDLQTKDPQKPSPIRSFPWLRGY
ncbi:MAG TPA: hypothetical protein VH858_07475 [Hyphomicrobiales bacterium]|jgi:hypothetical protein